jgi:hypothetical protein
MHSDEGATTTRTTARSADHTAGRTIGRAFGRTALLAGAVGLLTLVLLGSAALPALADPATATVTTTAGTAGQVAERGAGQSSSDVIVAGLAALGMLATAIAVLWHTARTRGTHLL